jgi:hypothetical protein
MTGLAGGALDADPHVFLIGRPPIGELLGFIRNMAVDGQTSDLGSLTEQWRTANDHVLELERAEAGAADSPPIQPVPDDVQALREVVLADPVFRQAFRFVPTEVAIVDLDRLVVFQKFINLRFVEDLKAQLGELASIEQVFRFSLLDPQQPQSRAMQNAQNLYTFSSPSTDLRFLEAQLLQPQQIPAFQSTGRPIAIIALAVGYGSNFLNVLSVDGRLVLNNGSHRAYALRDVGVHTAPALVQHVTRRDELELVASGDFASNPDRYLKTPRPPMLKDYFDTALRVVVPVYRKNRTVRVQFVFEQMDMPA